MGLQGFVQIDWLIGYLLIDEVPTEMLALLLLELVVEASVLKNRRAFVNLALL